MVQTSGRDRTKQPERVSLAPAAFVCVAEMGWMWVWVAPWMDLWRFCFGSTIKSTQKWVYNSRSVTALNVMFNSLRWIVFSISPSAEYGHSVLETCFSLWLWSESVKDRILVTLGLWVLCYFAVLSPSLTRPFVRIVIRDQIKLGAFRCAV